MLLVRTAARLFSTTDLYLDLLVPDIVAHALLKGDLSLVFQPIRKIYDSTDLEADYFEVLLRVKGGSPIAFLGRLSPQDYLKLDLWVFQQVCRLPRSCRYALNLSPGSLANHHFMELLVASNHQLVIEVTEHHAAELTETGLLIELCKQFPVVLDDLGSAYSGLNRLFGFKFDGIKIDGHLITPLEDDMRARAIVGHLMTMAQELGVYCVCEYVETPKLWEVLKALHDRYAPGLDLYVQGWAAGMPIANVASSPSLRA